MEILHGRLYSRDLLNVVLAREDLGEILHESMVIGNFQVPDLLDLLFKICALFMKRTLLCFAEVLNSLIE